MSCRENCCLSQLESDVRPISRLFSPPWQGWGHFSVHECVSCIHEAFWHHSPFCYELDLGSALLSAAIWCGGKRLSKRERDWGTAAEGRKKSNSGRWNWFIFRAKGASDWDWWRGGGMPWNRKLSPEQASRLFGWQPGCACSPGAALENKHAHFCDLSNASREPYSPSASAPELSSFSSACDLPGFGEQNLSALPCVRNCQVLDWQW